MAPTQLAILLVNHTGDFNAYSLRCLTIACHSAEGFWLLVDREVIPFSKMGPFSVNSIVTWHYKIYNTLVMVRQVITINVVNI